MKKLLSLALCAVLLFSALGVSALAANAEDYTNLPYQNYVYLGDSISWGYGLDPDLDRTDKFSVGKRVEGSFTDLIADVLEQNNSAEIYPAASSGSRLCDYRILLERGMGVENPYERVNDWYGNRHPERTEEIRNKGPEVCAWLADADLVTLQVGINDLTTALLNAASATGLVDMDKIQEISLSDLSTVAAYLNMVLQNLAKDPDVLGNLIRTFNSEISGIRENACEVVKDIVEVAPENADIVIVGYHKAVQGMRILPGTDFSVIFDIVDTALMSLNDYFDSVASNYKNVYYVDAPDCTVFYPEGTKLTDAIQNIKGFLMGIHPDAAGHVYIADQVLNFLRDLNTCRHEHTHTVWHNFKLGWNCEYENAVVCDDCGQIVSYGRLITPQGSVTPPTHTVQNTIAAVSKNITAVFNRLNVLRLSK